MTYSLQPTGVNWVAIAASSGLQPILCRQVRFYKTCMHLMFFLGAARRDIKVILYHLQKALILGVLLGVVCFHSTTFLYSEVRFLFPYSQCNMSELTENSQQAGTSTHTLYFPEKCTRGKGYLGQRGTVNLIKSNDVSSLCQYNI